MENGKNCTDDCRIILQEWKKDGTAIFFQFWPDDDNDDDDDENDNNDAHGFNPN